eukprot:gene7635-9392_t
MVSLGSLSNTPNRSGSSSQSSYSYSLQSLSLEELKKPVYDIQKHLQSEERIRLEFRSLEELNSTHPNETSEGDKKYNSCKNRYTNILPCNRTRVILEKIGDKEGSDYINANFIDGIYAKQYICTQGPLQNTILDFWRMVWENDSRIIVMLSKEQENCRPKCDRYWPESTTDTSLNCWSEGKFTIQLMSVVRDDKREIIFRNIQLTNLQLKESRIITHYQYEGWPDHNAPSDTEPLRFLLHTINENQQSLPVEDRNNPIIVHCSAGVGRTGTFCTVHIMMKRLEQIYSLENTDSEGSKTGRDGLTMSKEEEKELIDFNLYNIVSHLRQQRPGMVQQLEQYMFCYKILSEMIKERKLMLASQKLLDRYKNNNNDSNNINNNNSNNNSSPSTTTSTASKSSPSLTSSS